MFGFGKKKKKAFMEGMMAGASPFEEKFKSQEDAIERVGKSINTKLDAINSVTDIIIDELSSKQKKELYDLNTKYDIATVLKDDEKDFLASVLVTIASQCRQTNEYQQNFIRSVLSYIGIPNPQPSVDLSCIENIENINTQKAILQVILEFLFLQEGNFKFLNSYDSLISYFSVNKNSKEVIINNIETIFKATGLKGLSEKYGYIPVEEEIPDSSYHTSGIVTSKQFNKEQWENYYMGRFPQNTVNRGSYAGHGLWDITEGYSIADKIYYLEKDTLDGHTYLQLKSMDLDMTNENTLLVDVGSTNGGIMASKNYVLIFKRYRPVQNYNPEQGAVMYDINADKCIDIPECHYCFYLNDDYFVYGGTQTYEHSYTTSLQVYDYRNRTNTRLDNQVFIGQDRVPGIMLAHTIEFCYYRHGEDLYYSTVSNPLDRNYHYTIKKLSLHNVNDIKIVKSFDACSGGAPTFSVDKNVLLFSIIKYNDYCKVTYPITKLK